MNRYAKHHYAPAEERSRISNRQKRFYFITGAVSVFAVTVLIGLLVPIFVLQAADTEQGKKAKELASDASEYWVGVFRNAILEAITVSYTITGLVVGTLEELPPLNGTPEERVAEQFFSQFPPLAEQLRSSSPNLALLATAPGGVVYQMSPVVHRLWMYDMLYNYTAPLLGTPDIIDTLDNGGTMVIGPQKRNIDEEEAVVLRWDVDVIQSVYSMAGAQRHGIDNFWGFAVVVLSLTSLVQDKGLWAYMEENGLEFLMFTRVVEDNESTIVPIYATLPEDSTQAFYKAFVSKGELRSILSSKMNWELAVHKPVSKVFLSESSIATIVATVLGGSLVLLVTAIACVLVHTKEYDGRRYAPRRVPFAILTIGPCNGSTLWNLASEQMVEVSAKLNTVFNKAMTDHKAYPITQLHPFTNSYVTRTVHSAVHMAFSALEELQTHPVDTALCRLLAEDGKVLVSCAIHWCTDASVVVEPGHGSYRFDGYDVMYGGRMWFFAAPNAVTLSAAAKDNRGPKLSEMKVTPFNSVYLRGFPNLQQLFVISDLTNKRLKEAASAASVHLAHMRRLTQWRLGEESGEDDYGLSALAEASRASSSIHNPLEGFHTLASAAGVTPSGTHAVHRESGSLSASTSVVSCPLERQRAGGRVMLQQPWRLAAASSSSVVGVSVSTPTSLREGNDGAGSPALSPLQQSQLQSPSQSQSPSQQVKSPTVVAKSGSKGRFVVSTMVPSSSSTAANSTAAVTSGAESDAAPVMLGASAGGRNDNGSFSSSSVNAPISGPAPVVIVTSAARRSSAGDAMQLSGFARLSPCGPCVARGGGCEAERGGGSASVTSFGFPSVSPASSAAFAASATVLSARLPARHGLSDGNPLRIDVPAANPLAPRRSSAPTASTLGIPSSSSTLRGSPPTGPPGARHPRSSITTADGGCGAAAAASSLSLLSQDGPNSMITAHDNGPLGGHRFQSLPASAGGSASGPTSADHSAAKHVFDRSGTGTTAESGDGEDEDSASALISALLHPAVPLWMNVTLRAAYEHQALDVDISYDSVRILVYYFFVNYKLLFWPLGTQERASIYKRLTAVFGVPQHNTLEHLAAQCSLHYMKYNEEARAFLLEPTIRAAPEARKKSRRKR